MFLSQVRRYFDKADVNKDGKLSQAWLNVLTSKSCIPSFTYILTFKTNFVILSLQEKSY